MKKKLLFSILIVVGILSCHKSEEHSAEHAPPSGQLLETLVPASRLPLYADLSDYNLSFGYSIRTKSALDNEGAVTLRSQLNFSETKEVEFKGVHYTQIPFFNNDSPEHLSILYDDESEITSDKLASVRKYYVETVRSEGTQSFVVTMIPTKASFEQDPGYDYLQKPKYSGIILFSSVEGKLLDTRAYAGGRIMRAKLVPKEELGSDNAAFVHYCSFLEPSHITKSGGEPEFITHWNGNAAICIAYVIVPSYSYGNYPGWGNAGGGEWSPYSPGSGAYDPSNPYLDHGVETPPDEEDPYPDEVSITVSVTCNVPNYIEMIGSGEYSPGAIVTIGYSYCHQVSYYSFKWWVGGFSGITTPVFLYRADQDIESTAYFDDGTVYPCSDATRQVTNPLVNMSIAPSNSYGNYRGGTYGWTRTDANGGARRHDGLDLAAPPGTPVYSMFTGVVTRVFTEAPDPNDNVNSMKYN